MNPFKVFFLLYLFSPCLLLAKSEYDHCFFEAGLRFSLNPMLLKAIAITESSLNPNAVSATNANGSVDIGLMQINSSWLPRLKRFGINKQHLFDPCISIFVGAWVLAGNVAIHGSTWSAVGFYNSSSPAMQLRYVKKVKLHYDILLNPVDSKFKKLKK